MSSTNQITIPQFYVGKTIFITGGTGFIGKVLIEKLLRSCPEIRTIYILIRPKRGQNPEERIKTITQLPLFDRLKNENLAENLKKIKPIVGNMCELGLGLKPEDRQILIDQVDIIFHSAASVRFDDPLKTAIIANVRSTRELANLALEMKNLICLAHISTSYCHIDKSVIEERIYPPVADWKEAIRIAEEVDEHILNVLTMKFMGPFPNSYTFAKNLAENVIADLCEGKIPTIIVRPSIVISSALEPFPGWIDNFNGPVALLIASGKGILRSAYCPPDITLDYITIDIVVKGLVLGIWWKLIVCDPSRRYDVEVFNGSNNGIIPVTMNQMIEMGKSFAFKYPLSNILWYPGGDVTSCWYYHYFRVIFYHLLPAFFVDIALKLSGNNKLRLMKIQQKIYSANMALNYFMRNEWKFINVKGKALEKDLLPSDYDNFFYGEDLIEPYAFFESACLGGRKYLMKEDDSTLESARKNSTRMWFLSVFFNIFWYLIIIWLLFVKIDVLSIIRYRIFGFD